MLKKKPGWKTDEGTCNRMFLYRYLLVFERYFLNKGCQVEPTIYFAVVLKILRFQVDDTSIEFATLLTHTAFYIRPFYIVLMKAHVEISF